MKKQLEKLSERRIGYIIGFLEADGCINAQIVSRKDYKLRFQIRVSVTFFQKKRRKHVLLHLQRDLDKGTLRTRPDGICELTLIGHQTVLPFLEFIVNDLEGKRPQAMKVIEICRRLQAGSKNMSPAELLQLCEIVDQIGIENDSKKRTITSEIVRSVVFEDSP